MPDDPILGAEQVHGLLVSWRTLLHGDEARPTSEEQPAPGQPVAATD